MRNQFPPIPLNGFCISVSTCSFPWPQNSHGESMCLIHNKSHPSCHWMLLSFCKESSASLISFEKFILSITHCFFVVFFFFLKFNLILHVKSHWQGFAYLPAGVCVSSMGRPVSYEQAIAWKVLDDEDSNHCLAFMFTNWSFL